MTDPTPDEVPPVTTPVDPEVLATPDSGLDWRPGPPKQVVIIGAGLAGLVAAFELKRQGHDVDRPRGAEPGRRPDLHAAHVRARPLRRGRRDAHPARPRPDPALLRPVRPPASPVRDGQPQGARPHRRRADDEGGGGPRPWSPAVHRRGARARPQRRRALGIDDRRPPSDGRATKATPAWEHIVREYDQYSLYEFLRHKGWSRGRDRVLRRHELPRSRHAQRGRRDAARGPRRRVCRHAGDRRRDGRAARTPSTGSSRTRSASGRTSSPSTRTPTG